MRYYRYYCERVGAVFTYDETQPCPECGSSSHERYDEPNCGDYFRGQHCTLPIGHEGSCGSIWLEMYKVHDLEVQ
jgi:hypothetical protein